MSAVISDAEREVLQALWDTEGGTDKDIARRLGKSTSTVHNQMLAVNAKLETRTRTWALIEALRADLIEAEL